MKKFLEKIIVFAVLFSVSISGAGTEKLSTPYWEFVYKGNGQIKIQNNAVLNIESVIDVSSNITGFIFDGIAATNSTYGVDDNSHFILWIENDDGKGKLLAKPNKKNKTVAIQNFTIVASNSSLKKITVKVGNNNFIDENKSIGGVISDPFFGSASFPSAIFVDGDIGTLNLNCDLFGSLIYAENIGTLKFKNSDFASIMVGSPDKFIHGVVIGSVTNNNLMTFKAGTIGKLIANRIMNTIISTGGALPNCLMDDAPSAFATPLLAPKGSIGSLKAKEIGAWGDYEEEKWWLSDKFFLNKISVVLSSEIKKFNVKNITTENTSVYIHGR